MQADSLPTELAGKPVLNFLLQNLIMCFHQEGEICRQGILATPLPQGQGQSLLFQSAVHVVGFVFQPWHPSTDLWGMPSFRVTPLWSLHVAAPHPCHLLPELCVLSLIELRSAQASISGVCGQSIGPHSGALALEASRWCRRLPWPGESICVSRPP